MVYALALLIGVIGGLRAMMAPAAVSWAAAHGWLALEGSWLVFLGWRYTPWILTLLALVELVTDQLPSTPSRTVPVQLGTRIVVGALCGAAIGVPAGAAGVGLVLGVLGALLGTYGGAALRSRLAGGFGSDRPAALIEDGLAIFGVLLLLLCL